MSDPDSPVVTEKICPGCHPDEADVFRLIEVWPCPQHTVSAGGIDDGMMSGDAPLSGGAECEGETNRAWCALVHRRD